MNASLEPKVLRIPSTSSYLILFWRHILFGEIHRNPDGKATALQTSSHNRDGLWVNTVVVTLKAGVSMGLQERQAVSCSLSSFIGRNLLILINHGPRMTPPPPALPLLLNKETSQPDPYTHGFMWSSFNSHSTVHVFGRPIYKGLCGHPRLTNHPVDERVHDCYSGDSKIGRGWRELMERSALLHFLMRDGSTQGHF